VYSYGSLLLDYLARTRGPEKIPEFVDRTSRVIWPLSLNAKAKGIFGISFENAFRDWRDSLVRTSAHSEPLPQWRDLTRDGRYVASPRWLNDTTLIYTAANGKEVTAAYTVTLSGNVDRIGRRNGLDVNSVARDGSIVYAQSDYVDAYHYRTDLWVHRNGEDVQLTHGARLSQPDVRANGDIVAVQAVPGSSRIVIVSPDGSEFARSLTVMQHRSGLSRGGRLMERESLRCGSARARFRQSSCSTLCNRPTVLLRHRAPFFRRHRGRQMDRRFSSHRMARA
jgi:hypothetical protein